MAKRFLTPTEFVNLSVDPEEGSAGQMYFNTIESAFKYNDGTSWRFFLIDSENVYDGGTPSTFVFEENLNGGDPFETIFIGIYDGGQV